MRRTRSEARVGYFREQTPIVLRQLSFAQAISDVIMHPDPALRLTVINQCFGSNIAPEIMPHYPPPDKVGRNLRIPQDEEFFEFTSIYGGVSLLVLDLDLCTEERATKLLSYVGTHADQVFRSSDMGHTFFEPTSVKSPSEVVWICIDEVDAWDLVEMRELFSRLLWRMHYSACKSELDVASSSSSVRIWMTGNLSKAKGEVVSFIESWMQHWQACGRSYARPQCI